MSLPGRRIHLSILHAGWMVQGRSLDQVMEMASDPSLAAVGGRSPETMVVMAA